MKAARFEASITDKTSCAVQLFKASFLPTSFNQPCKLISYLVSIGSVDTETMKAQKRTSKT